VVLCPKLGRFQWVANGTWAGGNDADIVVPAEVQTQSLALRWDWFVKTSENAFSFLGREISLREGPVVTAQ